MTRRLPQGTSSEWLPRRQAVQEVPRHAPSRDGGGREALAAALHVQDFGKQPTFMPCGHSEYAAAILAALDGYVLVPVSDSAADTYQTHHQPDTTCPICRYTQDHLVPVGLVEAAQFALSMVINATVDDRSWWTAACDAERALRAAIEEPKP